MAPPQKKKLKPGQRRARPIATHITNAEEDEREKHLHVVRDRDWHVFGANLLWSAANKLAQHVAGRRKSDTVRVELMPTDPELLSFCATAEVVGAPLPPAVKAPTPEAVARQAAAKAIGDAQRVADLANKGLAEARRRAQFAHQAATKAMADAEAQRVAVEVAAAAAGVAPAAPNGESDDPIDPALLAESEALEDASLEDILAD